MGLAGFSHNSYSLDLVWKSWLIFVAVLPVGSGVREVFGELGAVGAGFKFVDVVLNWGCAEILLSMAIIIEKYHGCGLYKQVLILQLIREDDHKESAEDEVEKVIIEEKRVCSSGLADGNIPSLNLTTGLLASSPQKPEDTESSRRLRIQNIFTLCGNNRELSQHTRTPVPAKRNAENIDPLACRLKTVSSVPMVEPVMALASKENYNPSSKSNDVQEPTVFASPMPVNPIENKLFTSTPPHLSSTPFITLKRGISRVQRVLGV
ncbi:hypothetical protein WN943_029137 [Citrus x changshan-huyou]